jgi:WD repeat-containing protein 68
VVQLSEESGKFVSRGTFDHPYPTTKIMWLPDKTGSKEDLVATTGDYLRLWHVMDVAPIKMMCLLNTVCGVAMDGYEVGGEGPEPID